MVGNRSSLLQYNNVKVIPKSIIYGEKQTGGEIQPPTDGSVFNRAGRPRPYDVGKETHVQVGRGDPAPTMMRDFWDYADYVL